MSVSFNSEVDVPYVYRYDASADSWSSNESGNAAFDYFPDDAGVGDCLYFGFEPYKGFPQSVKLNIGQALKADFITLDLKGSYQI